MTLTYAGPAEHVNTHNNHIRALKYFQSVGFNTNATDHFGFDVDEYLDIPTATFANEDEALNMLTHISYMRNIEVTETHHYYDCDSARWHEQEFANSDIQSLLTMVVDSRANPERFSCAYVAMNSHGSRTVDSTKPMVFIIELGDEGEPSTYVFTLQVV